MRKHVKKDLLEIIKQLDKANETIRKKAEALSQEQALSVLAECQQSALTMGNRIEEDEGEGTQTVTLLEQYCEEVYSLCVNWNNVQAVEKGIKHIKGLLYKISDSIRYDLPDSKVEVVFLPYKASMWDSLESVWMAARDDENCNAYVIPIPYFDKNPDGSFAEMHYEGDEYPDYVPITRYDEYDFERRHPDIIYIHNPYDEWNHVTSVHPFFYSKNLKKFTDKLVYIPYFVLGEVNPENEEAIKKMEHFCTVPAVLYADKVVVQSEDMRKVYIKVITDWLGKEKARELNIEEKILGLGSPKFDKISSVRKEDIEIPEGWQKIIQKPDGSSKKIILYNTGVDALLKHSDKMLAKIKDVLRIFKENQEEVALLWRPHPLIRATIESMRPELWQEYSAIVEQYREESWGIYDDTADMDRAIAISDAYYGDGSSLVQLYQKTGKPVMIQNVEIIENIVNG